LRPADPDDQGAPTLDVNVLVGALERHGVEYLVVGGVAATAHGAQRLTKGLDCLPRREPKNLNRLAAAMRELGARLRVGRTSDEEAKALLVQLDGRVHLKCLRGPWGPMLAVSELTTWRTDAGDFDVLADIPSSDGRRVGYEELADRAVVVQVDQSTIRIASLEDIIASKEWANRPKDHEALPELHEIAGTARVRTPRGSTGQLLSAAHPTGGDGITAAARRPVGNGTGRATN
jgi:hypothetical protein